MKVLSLFDGMSCGRIALERAGIPVEVYYASEIDKYAQIVSDRNYPDIIRLGSVENWKEWDIETPDLIIAGSPCQGLSIAGKRLGLDDPRSRLFYVFVDILRHYQKINPNLKFLLENVNRMPKADKQIITEMLGVESIMINSALLSAQNRERLYWTNIEDVGYPCGKDIILADIIEDGYTDRQKSFCLDANYAKGGNPKQYFEKGRRQLILVGSAADSNSYKMDKSVYSVMGKSPAVRAEGKPGKISILQRPRGNNKGGERALDGKTPAMSSSSWQDNNYLLLGRDYRKLTVKECERLQTIPDDYTLVMENEKQKVSNSQRYKMIGNGWTVDVIAHIFSYLT